MTNRSRFLWLLVPAGMVACAEAPPRPRATKAPRPPDSAALPSAARALEKPPLEPCARIEARRRAFPVPSIDPKLAEAFSRCRTSDEGAWGLLVTASRDDAVTFVVALERVDGILATSEPHTTRVQGLAPELVVLPRPGTSSLVMAKLPGQLVPVPFGAPAPVQTRAFFADALGGAPSAEYPWIDFTTEADGYVLDFELPSLRWQDPVPYGGQREAALRGVRVRMPLDPALHPRAGHEPWDAVRKACAAVPAVSKASGKDLWAAAQCARIGGLEGAKVLAQVKERCSVLAARALPLVVATARADARARDGLPPDKTPRPSPEEWARAEPPGACFDWHDRLWDVDYTARAAPFRVPRITLDSAWENGLPRTEH